MTEESKPHIPLYVHLAYGTMLAQFKQELPTADSKILANDVDTSSTSYQN